LQLSWKKYEKSTNFSAFNFIPSIPFNEKQTTGFLKFFFDFSLRNFFTSNFEDF
jgi:hypothetical protein